MNDVTDKEIASMLLDLSNIISVLLGGAIGFIAKYFLELKKMKEDKKAIRQQMITNNIAPMRERWINNVREQISALITTSDFTRTYLHDFKSDDSIFKDENERFRLTAEYGTEAIRILNNIKLLLPVNEPDYSSLIIDLEKLTKNIIDNSLEKSNREDFVDKIINSSRSLLKKEWEVTKSLKEIEENKGIIEKIIKIKNIILKK